MESRSERVVELDGPIPQVNQWYFDGDEKRMAVLLATNGQREPVVLLASFSIGRLHIFGFVPATSPIFGKPCDPPVGFAPVRFSVRRNDADVVAGVIGGAALPLPEHLQFVQFAVGAKSHLLDRDVVAKLAAAIRNQ